MTPEGLVTAVVSVTGTVDEVEDLIVPGAYGATLAHRKPKGVKAHDWKIDVARVLYAEEWMPGDRRLPKAGPDGKAWPREAGALVVTLQYNMAVQRAREEWEMVRFYADSGEACFSIGYRVAAGKASKRADGVRVIHELELFEISSVLHGAHPGTMALDVKNAPAGLEWKAASGYWGVKAVEDAAPKDPNAPGVAGVAVRAVDTGRVLMLQRALTDDDPAAGAWEFPGGHVEDGEDPLEGGQREWCEETGMPFPDGELTGEWDSSNGVYRGHVWSVPSETDVEINPDHEDRTVLNPDDPDGDQVETVAWWDPEHLDDNPAVRAELADDLGRVRRALRSGKKAAARAVMQAKAMPVPVRRGTRVEVKDAEHPGHGNEGNIKPILDWFTHGDGAAEIAWGTPGDFDRCTALAGKHMTAEQAKGFCNLRHKEATGMYPATHAKLDRGGKTHPGMSAKAAVLAARNLETKTMPYMIGSMEWLQDKLRDAARDLLFPAADGADRGWVSLTATYPDHVVVDASGDAGCESYSIPYQVDDSGDVTLGAPQAVDVVAVAVPEGADGDDDSPGDAAPAGKDAEVQARFVAPVLDSLKDAAGRLSMAPLAGKQLEVSVQAGVLALLDELAVKGADVARMVMGDDDPEDHLDGGADEDVEDGEAAAAPPKPPKPTPGKGMPPQFRKPAAPAGTTDDDPEDAVDGGSDEAAEDDGSGGGDAVTDPDSGPASADEAAADDTDGGDGDPEDATDGGSDEDEEDSQGRVTLTREDLTKQLLELNAE